MRGMLLAWLVVTVPLAVVAYFACRKRRVSRTAGDMANVFEDEKEEKGV